MKRIALFLDGTWNQLDSEVRPVTNVVKLAQSVALKTGDSEQVVYYDEGVGVGDNAVARRIESSAGGIFGAGLERNLEEAYRFLIFNYEPGDEIYLFGFSRGAFTARSLVGLINNVGLLSAHHADKIGKAMDHYRSRSKTKAPNANASRDFRKTYSRQDCVIDAGDTWHPADTPQFRIHFMGIWDTVGSLGIPALDPTNRLLRRLDQRYRFHDTKLSLLVRNAYHALALDERRKSFSAVPWTNLSGLRTRDPSARFEQLWFPGDHGSVGGGGDILGLSDGALEWIAHAAENHGLVLRADAHAPTQSLHPDHLVPLENMSETEKDRLRQGFWDNVIGTVMDNLPPSTRKSKGTLSLETLSDSALYRCRDDAGYRSRHMLKSLRLSESDVDAEISRRSTVSTPAPALPIAE